MAEVGRCSLSIQLSQPVREWMLKHCLAKGLSEGEFVEAAILEWLEREEGLERCFQGWEALLTESIR